MLLAACFRDQILFEIGHGNIRKKYCCINVYFAALHQSLGFFVTHPHLYPHTAYYIVYQIICMASLYHYVGNDLYTLRVMFPSA